MCVFVFVNYARARNALASFRCEAADTQSVRKSLPLICSQVGLPSPACTIHRECLNTFATCQHFLQRRYPKRVSTTKLQRNKAKYILTTDSFISPAGIERLQHDFRAFEKGEVYAQSNRSMKCLNVGHSNAPHSSRLLSNRSDRRVCADPPQSDNQFNKRTLRNAATLLEADLLCC
jgi:hypothetical protein